MKKKIVYLLVVAIGLSLFSSAKQVGQYCDKKVVVVKKKNCKQNTRKPVDQRSGVDLSPLNFFLNN